MAGMSLTYKQSLLLRKGGSVATDPQSRNEQSRWVKTRQHNPAMASHGTGSDHCSQVTSSKINTQRGPWNRGHLLIPCP